MKERFRRAGSFILVLCLLLSMPHLSVLVEGNTQDSAQIDISDEIKAGLPTSFSYTGNPVSFDLPYNKIGEWSVVYFDGDAGTFDAPSAVGNYTVNITGKSNDYYANISHSFSIVEAEIDYTATEYYGPYDGQAHSIGLDVTTEGVSVSYATARDGAYSENLPTFTDAGTYTVWFKLEKDNYQPVLSSETVYIFPAMIQFTTTGYEVPYDGNPHSIQLKVDTEDVMLTYATSSDGEYSSVLPMFTDPGEYTVWFKIEKKNYDTVLSDAMFVITQPEIQYSASDYSGCYDGEAHSIAVNAATEGVSVTYAASENGKYSATNPAYTESGTYTVWFKLEKENHKTVTDSATVSITKADVSDKVSFNNQESYIYTGEPVDFAPNCEGIDEWSYTYFENDTELPAAPVGQSSYCVAISGEGTNYVANVSHMYRIICETSHTEETIPGKAATCTESGLTEGKKCSVCGKILEVQKEIPAKDHEMVVTVPAKAATCTEAGNTEGTKCKNCDYKVASEVIKATGHTEENIPGKAATCTETGLTEGKKCSVCGKVLTEQKVVETTAHKPETDAAVAATCTKTGLTEGSHCSVCQTVLVKQEVTEKADHKPVIDAAVAATCTATGLTEGSHCSVCGEVLEAQDVVSAKGHTLETDEAVAATCTATGLTEGAHCSVCKEVLVKQEVTEKVDHKPVIDAAVEATCTATGLTEGAHCSVCSKVLTEQKAVETTAHKPETDAAVAATCTATGLTEGSHCSVCQTVLVKQEVTEKVDHKPVTDAAVEATCTETGLTEGSHCSVCGEILEAQDVVSAKGHTPVTDAAVEATCTESGLTEGSHCLICGEILEAQTEVAAKEHTPVTDAEKAATCMATGLTEGSHCSVCGEILKAQEEISKTAHKEEIIPGKAATCTETGLTAGKKCSVCGEILTPQKETPLSEIHRIVPAQDQDPNAGSLDYICLLCGKSWTGLMGDDTFSLLTCERADLSSDSNGFQITAGSGSTAEGSSEAAASEVASGKLQVYKNEYGNYVNIICLVSPDSTVSYLSFESGSTYIGDIMIASQNNPGGGMIIVSTGESVDQLGLGIGVDENGKTYLYVMEDGVETSFTVTREAGEDGKNSIVLNTENNSSIMIGSDSINYQIQFEEEDSAPSGTRLKMEKTTDSNTSDAADTDSGTSDVQIVFSTGGQDATDNPQIQKHEEVSMEIQVYREPDSDSTGQVIESQQQTEAENYVDIIEGDKDVKTVSRRVEFTYESAKSGDREGGGGLPNWEDFKRGAKCDFGSHDWRANKDYYGNCPQCHCPYCGKNKDHKWKDGSPECRCSSCNYYRDHTWREWDGKCYHCEKECKHSWINERGREENKCAICHFSCSHEKWIDKDGYCTCKKCGTKASHDNEKISDKKCKCTVCGTEKKHKWISLGSGNPSDRICARCFSQCSHKWKDEKGKCTCSICGVTRGHSYKKKTDEKCRCKYCGKEDKHDWENGECQRCIYICIHSKGWKDKDGKCTCKICGYQQSHDYKKQSNEKCKCKNCGKEDKHKWISMGSGNALARFCSRCYAECSHNWKEQKGKCTCKICGVTRSHSYVKGTEEKCRCKYCGKEEKHDWEDGKCKRCYYECTHSKGCKDKDGKCVCKTCGYKQSHDYKKQSNEKCKCKNCGREEKHKWISMGSGNALARFCSRCYAECSHNWKEQKGKCTCKICGVTRSHSYVKGTEEKCRCKYCGKEEKHDWENGKCKRCGYGCTHSKGWKDQKGKCVCKICGYQSAHSFDAITPAAAKCKCKNCGKEENHSWKDSTCTRCKSVCKHKSGWKDKDGKCVCKLCGYKEGHVWMVYRKNDVKCGQCGKVTSYEKAIRSN